MIDYVYVMWDKIIGYFKRNKEMKKVKQDKDVETKTEESIKIEAPTIDINNQAYGLIASKGKFTIVEIGFDESNNYVAPLKIVEVCSARDEAIERMKILFGRNVFNRQMK